MLKDKVILITGASRGIGRAIAIKCAENGAGVIVNYREHEGYAKEVVDKIMEKGGDAFAIKADVSQIAEVKEMFKMIRERYGRLDVLVNNAGVIQDNLLLMTREKDYDHIVNTNLKGAFFCMQFAVKIMTNMEKGKIINVSSIVGRYGNTGQIAYAASKAGIIGMTLSAAKELGQFGITVNAVAPGVIDTDMTKDLKSEIKERLIKSISLKQGIGEPEDVAKVVLFLASDLADYISGQVIGVDGCQII
jgi:3-oxoacyl-[acyl-carrier protein] reductase